MAIIFELWVESKDEAGLQNLKDHFHNLEHTLLTGTTIRFHAAIENNDVRGVCVSTFQIGKGYGIENLKDALEATEAGIFLYNRLRSAPDFRFAEVGWDAENRTSVELPEYVSIGLNDRKHWNGFECVLDDELFKEIGSPSNFWQFREGYWWRKYQGETYNPLSSDDQNELRQLCEKLLPNNFDYSNGSFYNHSEDK
jgi:hypothetical protein